MDLNLIANNAAEQRVKTYLEENASEELAKKINEGVHVEKDGKTLIQKKTLAGFIQYATKKPERRPRKEREALVWTITRFLVGQSTTLKKTP